MEQPDRERGWLIPATRHVLCTYGRVGNPISEDSTVKPSYKGQRSVPSTDQKFRPTDEHLLEKNKAELDESAHDNKMAPLPGQHPSKFAEVDKDGQKGE